MIYCEVQDQDPQQVFKLVLVKHQNGRYGARAAYKPGSALGSLARACRQLSVEIVQMVASSSPVVLVVEPLMSMPISNCTTLSLKVVAIKHLVLKVMFAPGVPTAKMSEARAMLKLVDFGSSLMSLKILFGLDMSMDRPRHVRELLYRQGAKNFRHIIHDMKSQCETVILPKYPVEWKLRLTTLRPLRGKVGKYA